MRQLQHHIRTYIPNQQPQPDTTIIPGSESPKTDLQSYVRSFFVMVDLPLISSHHACNIPVSYHVSFFVSTTFFL